MPTEEEENGEPPFHPELEEFGRVEIYQRVFDKMKPGEKVIDMMKRIHKSGEPFDDIAAWVSELFVRGEIKIIDAGWAMTGLNAGKIGWMEELKWDLEENGEIIPDQTAETLGKRHRVLCAEDARVRIAGTEEWIPIEKIDFKFFVL